MLNAQSIHFLMNLHHIFKESYQAMSHLHIINHNLKDHMLVNF
jgi:hypothetical protein